MENRKGPVRKRGRPVVPSAALDRAMKDSYTSEIKNPIIFNDFASYFACTSLDICRKKHTDDFEDIYRMTKNGVYNGANPDDVCKIFSLSLLSGEVLDERYFRAALYMIVTADEATSQKLSELLREYLMLQAPCDENLKDYYITIIYDELKCSILNQKYYMFTLLETMELLLEVFEFEEKKKNQPSSTEMSKLIPSAKLEDFPSSILCRMLDVIFDILHQNLFISLIKRFIKKGKLSKQSQPILAMVVWDNIDPGSINDHCSTAFKILCVAPEEYTGFICRYIAMLAEVARLYDQQNEDEGCDFYPNFGFLCIEFASDFASFLLDHPAGIKKIEFLQPLWLKMLVSIYFLPFHLKTEFTLTSIVLFIKHKQDSRDPSILKLTGDEQKVLLGLVDAYFKVYRVNMKLHPTQTIDHTNPSDEKKDPSEDKKDSSEAKKDSSKDKKDSSEAKKDSSEDKMDLSGMKGASGTTRYSTESLDDFQFDIDYDRYFQDEVAFYELVSLFDQIAFEDKEAFQLVLRQTPSMP